MYIIQLCIFYHAVFVFVYVNYGLSPEIKLYYYNTDPCGTPVVIRNVLEIVSFITTY